MQLRVIVTIFVFSCSSLAWAMEQSSHVVPRSKKQEKGSTVTKQKKLKRAKKEVCNLGICNWLRKTITTPLWLEYHRDRLYKELQEAVCKDDNKKVYELINLGISPNGYYEWGTLKNKFLHEGIVKGNYNAVHALVQLGAVPEFDDVKKGFESSMPDHLRSVLLAKYINYLQSSTKPDSHWRTDVLKLVVQQGTQDQIARVLKNLPLSVKNRCMHKYESVSLLSYAFEHRFELVSFLLAQGAEITHHEIGRAITSGNVQHLHALLHCYFRSRKGKDMHEDELKARVRDSLICTEKNIPVEERTQKKAPFHVGLQYASCNMVDALVALGADVNWVNAEGRTALWYNTVAVDALMRHGALLDVKDAEGNMLVHHVTQSRSNLRDYQYHHDIRLERMLVYPRTNRHVAHDAHTRSAVFAALCCIKNICPSMPFDLRVRILKYVYNDGDLGCWGKYIKNVPLKKIVGTIPFNQELALCKWQQVSDGNYRCLLGPEAVIREHTRQHLIFLWDVLQQKDKNGKEPWQYAQDDSLHLKTFGWDYFEYHWRGKVEREYRFLIKNGFVSKN